MGTRGLYGIRKNGRDKCTYNHWDSYPDYLGKKILDFCASYSEEQISNLFDLIELFNTKIPPTEEQKKMCKVNGYLNLNVGTKSDTDWYCLLRELQGNIDAWDEAIKQKAKIPMEDSIDFIKDSVFCEHAYIINLDSHCLEYYKGFQKQPDPKNRYGCEENDGYYPCKLLLEMPLNDIKTVVDVKQWIERMNNINEN